MTFVTSIELTFYYLALKIIILFEDYIGSNFLVNVSTKLLKTI